MAGAHVTLKTKAAVTISLVLYPTPSAMTPSGVHSDPGERIARGWRVRSSRWATIAEVFAELDWNAARVKTSQLPGDYLELLVIDDDSNEVRRPESD